jgi:hypothetical protein
MTISSFNNSLLNGSLPQGVGANVNSKSANPSAAIQRDVLSEQTIRGMSLEEKRQTALQVVNRTLAQAYEKIASRGQAATTEYSAFEPLTAEKVANNILGFIERRLQLDVADGATPEQLAARLEAGLSGFKKGFAEASEKLEALSLLSPEIKADIGKTYDLVLEGVDALRAKFIESAAVPPATTESVKNTAPNAESIKSNTSTQSPSTLNVPDFIPSSSPASGSYLGYANYEYGRAREFSFELTTKEGDKVTIKAASSEGFALEAGRAGRGNSSVTALNASYSSSQSFSLTIEGDLSEAELVAINDLLGRVNDLAGKFFANDLDGAFAQAMSLGYDSEQIAGFALNLAQAEIQQVTKAYQTFEPARPLESNPVAGLKNESLLPLGNFIRDLLDSLERASIFPEPARLLTDMASKMPGETELDQVQGRRFSDFIKEILDLELR